jgi:hypothetical protein
MRRSGVLAATLTMAEIETLEFPVNLEANLAT